MVGVAPFVELWIVITFNSFIISGLAHQMLRTIADKMKGETMPAIPLRLAAGRPSEEYNS